MSTFYYWLPTDRTMNSKAMLAMLADAGLGYAFDGHLTSRTCDKGPDGNRGVTVMRGGTPDGKFGYWPEQQTWRRIPKNDLWCGMWTDDPPAPGDLARDDLVAGESVVLDDGHAWLVPIARRWIEDNGELAWLHNLPQRLCLSAEGQWCPGGVKRRYCRLWDLSVSYLNTTEDDDGIIRFTLDDLNALAVEALQANYRVGAVELDMLGVFDELARKHIIDVLLDVNALTTWITKKNERGQDGGST